jgi:hypothetical protein
MAREEFKERGKLLGSLEDRGKEILAYDDKGRPKARFDKSQNKTFDASGVEVGKGNQLKTILTKNAQETSSTAKSSFTAKSAAQAKNAKADSGKAAPGRVDYNAPRSPSGRMK